MQEKMSTWLERKRPLWLLLYVEKAQNERRFPHYAELGAMARRTLFEREVNGLISFLIGDTQSLKRIQETHEVQAEELTNHIPLREQLDFLAVRMDLVREQIEGDAETEVFRGRILALLDSAGRYYRSKLRAFEHDS